MDESTAELRSPILEEWTEDAEVSVVKSGTVHVWSVPLGPGDEAEQPSDLMRISAWSVLSDDERVRAQRFVRPRDRRRFALCRGALRMILGKVLRRSPASVRFRAGPGGKPELVPTPEAGGLETLRFNVTHSGNLALIAVSRDQELGVDLERMRPISQADRIVESYFTTEEQAQFMSLPEDDRASAFLRGWTRKEAILKAKGVGLAGLATCYQTMFGTGNLTSMFALASPHPWVGGWLLWEATPREGYVAALAVQAEKGDTTSGESPSR